MLFLAFTLLLTNPFADTVCIPSQQTGTLWDNLASVTYFCSSDLNFSIVINNIAQFLVFVNRYFLSFLSFYRFHYFFELESLVDTALYL